MKKNMMTIEERMINLMCLVPGINPAYAMFDDMAGENIPRI